MAIVSRALKGGPGARQAGGVAMLTFEFHDATGDVLLSGRAFSRVLRVATNGYSIDGVALQRYVKDVWRRQQYEYSSGARKADGRFIAGLKDGMWTYY